MYKNKFFLFVIACVSLIANICALEEVAPQLTDETSITDSHYESTSIELAPAHEIALRIKDGIIKQSDKVTYENEKYTVRELNVTTNENNLDYYDIRYALERPIFRSGMHYGTETLSVYVRNGIKPTTPSEKIKNTNAVNNTDFTVEVKRYNTEDYESEYSKAKKSTRDIKETISYILERISVTALTAAAAYMFIAVARQANRTK